MDYFVEVLQPRYDFEAVGLVEDGELAVAFPYRSGKNGLLVALEVLGFKPIELDDGAILAGDAYLESLQDVVKLVPKRIPSKTIIVPDPRFEYDEYAGLEWEPIGRKSMYLPDPGLFYVSINYHHKYGDEYREFGGLLLYAHPDDIGGGPYEGGLERLVEPLASRYDDIVDVTFEDDTPNEAGLYEVYVLFGDRRFGQYGT